MDTLSTKAHWRVDSYHLNTGLGDAAIHIVAYQKDKRNEARWVVWVDGGMGTNKSIGGFEASLRDIPKNYSNSSLITPLKFDVVIITHWDGDHYGGFSKFIKKITSMQHFYYTRDDRVPKTRFYWPACAARKAASFVKDVSKDLRIVHTTIGKNLYKLGVVQSGTYLLGMNLLTGNKLMDMLPSQVNSLKTLLATNKPGFEEGSNLPALYCVAVDEVVIGPHLYNGGDDTDVLWREVTTETNRSSIAVIIAWPEGRVSHYFAGDLGWLCECRIVKWLKRADQDADRIPTIKASHHGSCSSTPPLLISEFRPYNIVISAATKHFHPAKKDSLFRDMDRLSQNHAIQWIIIESVEDKDSDGRAGYRDSSGVGWDYELPSFTTKFTHGIRRSIREKWATEPFDYDLNYRSFLLRKKMKKSRKWNMRSNWDMAHRFHIPVPSSMNLPETQADLLTDFEETEYAYSFWSSMKKPQGATGSNIHRFLTTDPLDVIFNDMISQEIGLSQIPTEIPSVIPLAEHDDLTQWLKGSLGATQVSVQASTTNVKSLQFCLSNDAVNLIFDTAHAASSLPVVKTYPIGQNGVLSGNQRGLVVFGLSTRSKFQPSYTMADICGLFGALPKVHSTVLGLLGPFWHLDIENLKGERNGVWFAPYMAYNTAARLSFRLKPSTDPKLTGIIRKFFPNCKGLPVTSEERLIYKSVTHAPTDTGKEFTLMTTSSFTLLATVTLTVADSHGNDVSVILRVSCQLGGNNIVTLKVQSNNEENDFPAFISEMVWHISNSPVSIEDSLPEGFRGAMKALHFRSLSLTIGNKGLLGGQVDMEISTHLGEATNNPQNVALKFSASYERERNGSGLSLSGGLWFPITQDKQAPFSYFSDWEDVDQLVPITTDAADSLWLPGLLPEPIDVSSLPTNIPQEITEAEFFLSEEHLILSGTIESCTKYQPYEELPYLDFSEISIEAAFYWKTRRRTVDLEFRLGLVGPPYIDAPRETCTNQLVGSFSFDSDGSASKWMLSASIQDLNLGMLYQYFESDTQTLLYDILKEIEIRDLTISYASAADADPEITENTFLARGQFVISKHLSIELTFKRTAKDWKFSAGITENISNPVLLVDLATSVFGPESVIVKEIPDFLAKAEILGPNSHSPSVKFEVMKNGDSGVQLLLTARIGAIEASFIQLHKAVEGKKPEPIRYFCLTCDLPKLPPSPPLFSDFKAPFDQLGFLWTNRTLMADDLEAIARIKTPEESQKTKESQSGKKVEMEAGFHFTVLSSGVTVLDYLVGKTKAKDKLNDKSIGIGAESVAPKEDPLPGDAVDEQSPKVPFKKAQGPLSIEDIRLVYKEKTLAVRMNAIFAVGPLLFALRGFEISLEFGEKVSLSNIDLSHVHIGLDVMAASFKKPPLIIEGGLVRKKGNGEDVFAGGITIGFIPWLFQAAGFYGEKKKPGTDSTFTSALVYATLRGPLITLEFATISGITGGFGYNVGINIPNAADIYKFPLINPPAETDIMEVLDALISEDSPMWFYPEEGAMWLAAGLTITAFEMLDITAVLVAQWSPQIQFHVLGLAVADIPNAKSPFKLAHIELGFHASVDIAAGLFSVEAQLSPNSFILHPDCHLSGGFALYYWFKTTDVGREGDWVFTIGGYHSAFKVPPNYPRPPRLAISWALDNALSIKGEAYFAITPKTCMGGLHLNAVLSIGPLRAWFDAYVDFLINYAPFNFMAVGHVSIGVSYNMDVWFIHIHVSVEIGATLTLTGPPIAGVAHVEFWVFGFDIEFGKHGETINNDPLTIHQFFEIALSAGAPGDKLDHAAPHVYACLGGLISEGTKTKSESEMPWKIRGSLLVFEINAQFALNEATINDVKVPEPKDNWRDKAYAKPMREQSPLTSVLTVAITGPGSSKDAWRVKPVMKSVPEALWGKYDRRTDPTVTGNNSISELLSSDGGCARLMMGLEVRAPEPDFAHKEQLLPFNTEASMVKTVLNDPTANPRLPLPWWPLLPKHLAQDVAWTPAEPLPLPKIVGDQSNKDLGQWGAVNDAWKKSDPKPAVSAWSKLLGWKAPLKDTRPAYLSSNVHKHYLQAPRFFI
ncbi:hypothetical protein FMUND_4375 [Fusarium mundagurra]|uniref:DUF6603 domain-containing protein n=1 Tax=Fusarium mundagurra TaxID=1567541 RepID=A0A8H5YYU5_9HYPO|nr:hypothetical protein FMUND_4375 [Fusarium mundagurra]